MIYSPRFLAADRRTEAFEGGWSDDPADLGGETAYGISRTAHQDVTPWPPSREAAQYIRWRDYWDANRCDELPPLTAAQLYDWLVNSGGAPREFQKLLGEIKVDGDIGPATVARANAVAPTAAADLALAWNVLRQRCHYLADGTQAGHFVQGGDKTHWLEGHWLRTYECARALSDDAAALVAPAVRPIPAAAAAPKEIPMSSPSVPVAEPRAPSAPIVGAVRNVVNFAVSSLISLIPVAIFSKLGFIGAIAGLAEWTPESVTAWLSTLALAGVMAGLAALGKLARDGRLGKWFAWVGNFV